MAELGIDLHAVGAHPKRLEGAAVQASDAVRPIRDEIDRRVRALIDELLVADA